MDDDERPIRNFHRTVYIAAMEHFCRFPTLGTFTQAKVPRIFSDHLGQAGCQSDNIVVTEPDLQFLKYEDELEEQEDDEDEGYYDTPLHAFGDYRVRFELVFPQRSRSHKIMQQFVRYPDKSYSYDRAAVAVRALLANVKRERKVFCTCELQQVNQ